MAQNPKNLLKTLDADESKKIRSQAFDDFESDLESRAEWETKHAEYLALYHQQDRSDSIAWNGSSEESAPLLTEACHQFQARAYKAFFPKRQFISALALGADQRSIEANQRAERIGKYISYDLTVKNRYYKRDKKMLFLNVAIHGSEFSKTFLDPTTKHPLIQRVRAQDLIIPYSVGETDIAKIDRKTEIMHKSRVECRRLYDEGFFIKEPGIYDGSGVQTTELQEVIDEAQGIYKNQDSKRDPSCILEQHTFVEINGMYVPVIIHMDRQDRTLLAIYSRFRDDDKEKKPLEYYTHYQFFPNPDGVYGYGYGHLLAKLNTAINKILRQSIDAGELANVGNMSGWISEALGTKGGEVELQLGAFTKIPKSVENIRNAIYQMQFPGPNPAYMQIMQYLQNEAQRLASTTDAITGDVEKVLQPVTLMTMLDQSLQLPTSIMEDLASSMEDELEKYYECLKENTSTNISFDPPGENTQLLTVEDLMAPVKIVPIIDPKNITAQQKISKAQATFQFVMGNPLLAANPACVYEATKRVLEAMEVEDQEKLMPPMPPPVQNINNQEVENMYFLLPKEDRPPFDVFPDQDHMAHLMELDKFSSMGEFISEIAQDNETLMTMSMHRRKHMAYLYGIKEGVLKYATGQDGARTMVETGDNSIPAPTPGGGVSGAALAAPMSAGQGGAPSGPSGGSTLPSPMGDSSNTVGGGGILGMDPMRANAQPA